MTLHRAQKNGITPFAPFLRLTFNISCVQRLGPPRRDRKRTDHAPAPVTYSPCRISNS